MSDVHWDAANLTQLARSLTRTQFRNRVTGLFVVFQSSRLDSPQDPAPPSFDTQLHTRAQLEAQAAQDRVDTESPYQVIPVAKAPGNPYPDRISVGRARSCDIVVRDSSISKLHAHFKPRDGVLQLVDLDSSNGTRVDDRKIRPNEPIIVAAGARIEFGAIPTRLLDADGFYDVLK